MTAHTPPVGRRKPTNLSLDDALVAEARALGVNLSRAAETGILAAIRAETARRWQEENRGALLSSNAYVAEHGLPLAKHRLF
jgi:antitoxin CcdA